MTIGGGSSLWRASALAFFVRTSRSSSACQLASLLGDLALQTRNCLALALALVIGAEGRDDEAETNATPNRIESREGVRTRGTLLVQRGLGITEGPADRRPGGSARATGLRIDLVGVRARVDDLEVRGHVGVRRSSRPGRRRLVCRRPGAWLHRAAARAARALLAGVEALPSGFSVTASVSLLQAV